MNIANLPLLKVLRSRPRENHAGVGTGGGGGVTDLAYNLHAVITWCSIVKYGTVLV